MQNNYVDQTQTGKTSLAGSDVLNTVFANSVLRLPPAQWFTCDIRRQVFLTWLWATFQFNVDKTRVSGAGSGLVGSPGLQQAVLCAWRNLALPVKWRQPGRQGAFIAPSGELHCTAWTGQGGAVFTTTIVFSNKCFLRLNCQQFRLGLTSQLQSNWNFGIY